MHRRWIIIVAILPGYVALLAWVMTFGGLLLADTKDWHDVCNFMFSPMQWEIGDTAFLLLVGIPASVLALSQVAFLVPLVRVRHPVGGKAKSLRLSLVAAGLVAALLTVGLLASFHAFSQVLVSTASGRFDDPLDVELLDADVIVGGLAIAVVFSWLLWSVALMGFARRRAGNGVLGRTIGYLLGGTIVEVGIVLPIDIMIRRRTDCYCGSGTFWALCASGWALLWLAGPGILLAVISKRRRTWWELHCESCGYEKGPRPAEKCPECGHSWTAQAR
jgi:hypothetical protein